MINDQLLVGIVLIAAGVAIGLLAYALVLNRREAGRVAETGQEPLSEDLSPPEGQPEEEGASPVEAEMAQPDEYEHETVEASEAEAVVESAPDADASLAEPDSEEMLEAKEPAEPAPAPSPGGRRPIASLMRDDRTGKLVLVVGEREYLTPWDLKGTQDWTRIEQASRDLASWMSEVQPPEGEAGARAEKPSPQTKSLVDEVNEILKRKLSESGLTHRGVRLSEDRDGSVRVYIGIHGYTMDEIPDPEIREVIRQAVAEWESRG